MNLKTAKRAALAAVGLLTIDGQDISESYNLQNDRLIRLSYWADAAQKELALTRAPIKRTRQIVVSAPKNLINKSPGEIRNVKSYPNGSAQISAVGARSFYIETDGSCEVEVYAGGALIKRYSNLQNHGRFFALKGLIENEEGKEVTLIISSSSPYSFKNEAMYADTYNTANDIPDFSEYIAFNERVHNMYRALPGSVRFVGNNREMSDSYFEEQTLYLNNTRAGVWNVSYLAYPETITEDTPDEYEFEVPEYAHGAIVMKMAYGICVDMGFTNSTYAVFKNEYAELFNAIVPPERYSFTKMENAYGF